VGQRKQLVRSCCSVHFPLQIPARLSSGFSRKSSACVVYCCSVTQLAQTRSDTMLQQPSSLLARCSLLRHLAASHPAAAAAAAAPFSTSQPPADGAEIRWVFLGPPGVGKGTYSSRIAKHLGVPHIAAGDLVRAEIKSGSKLGQEVSGCVVVRMHFFGVMRLREGGGGWCLAGGCAGRLCAAGLWLPPSSGGRARRGGCATVVNLPDAAGFPA